MSRKYIDCREYPSDLHCSVALSADSDQELLEAAVQHAVSVHGQADTPEFRRELQKLFRDGTPPLERPMMPPPTRSGYQGTTQAGSQP